MFRALDKKTGQVRWETSVRSGQGKYFFHGGPLITTDIVVIGGDAPEGGGIHAFDRSIGRQQWTYPAGRGVPGTVSGLGRRAFAVTLEGQIVALDIDSGKRQWMFPIKVSGWEGASASANRVFAAATDGTLYALNAETGGVEWKASLGAAITTSVAVSGTVLYAGTSDGKLHRIDAQKGGISASYQIDSKLTPRDFPVVSGDSVLVLLADDSADNRALVSLDLNLDGIRWRQTAGTRWTTTRLFVLGNAVIMGTPAGEVTAWCVTNGSRAWSHVPGGTIRAIGGSEDILYIGTTEGSLTAIRPVLSCKER